MASPEAVIQHAEEHVEASKMAHVSRIKAEVAVLANYFFSRAGEGVYHQDWETRTFLERVYRPKVEELESWQEW